MTETSTCCRLLRMTRPLRGTRMTEGLRRVSTHTSSPRELPERGVCTPPTWTMTAISTFLLALTATTRSAGSRVTGSSHRISVRVLAKESFSQKLALTVLSLCLQLIWTMMATLTCSHRLKPIQQSAGTRTIASFESLHKRLRRCPHPRCQTLRRRQSQTQHHQTQRHLLYRSPRWHCRTLRKYLYRWRRLHLPQDQPFSLP
mmetsp:Transcript_6738/g.20534  ORF Transcript_6738/g.20534 Transcript_6738/m.20534 type:complete len:202 (+) Transcript_6738:235-840(+)